MLIFKTNLHPQGVLKIVPHLCDYCGGAIALIVSVFKQLHRSAFNLDFENYSLLIYGSGKANKWLLQKQHFSCSPAISK